MLEVLGAKLEENHITREQLLAERAPGFNPFLLGRLNEVGLSTVIGELLKPTGTHGQGNTFLALFLKKCGLDELAERCAHANVRLEHGTRGLENSERRRIDILIQGKTWLLSVENKPWTHDQEMQVSDYLRYMRGRAPQFHLLYLTADGKRPSRESIDEMAREKALDARELVLMSYRQIADWLEECADCCRAAGVTWFLKYLRDYVNRVVVGKPPEEVNQMLLKTVLEPAHLPAALRLLQAGEAIKTSLIRQLATDVGKQLPKGWKVGRVLVDDVILGIEIPGFVGGYFAVELEDGGRAFFGFKREKEPTDARLQALREFCARVQARDPNLELKPNEPWWPYWRWFDGNDDNAPSEYDNWNASIQPWIDMNNGKMAERIVTLARRLHSLGAGR